ncbi:unnamed protein product [Pipistrellus nathusii]|uniref:Uncharacterized protein n=1 Tax=Pipistrellus nathusii TaxID=59473 RepID=A0ABN9ZNF8_PIPNA
MCSSHGFCLSVSPPSWIHPVPPLRSALRSGWPALCGRLAGSRHSEPQTLSSVAGFREQQGQGAGRRKGRLGKVVQRALQAAAAQADTHTCTRSVPMAFSHHLLTKENQHSKEPRGDLGLPRAGPGVHPQLAQPRRPGRGLLCPPGCTPAFLVVASHDPVRFRECQAPGPRAIGTFGWVCGVTRLASQLPLPSRRGRSPRHLPFGKRPGSYPCPAREPTPPCAVLVGGLSEEAC